MGRASTVNYSITHILDVGIAHNTIDLWTADAASQEVLLLDVN
jgi:hypothetical protein